MLDTTKRIIVAGDFHGSEGWANRLVQYAKAHRIETILQVGDFGYWPHTSSGQRFLRGLSECLVENDVQLYWVDGNHENFDALTEAGAFRAEQPTETHPHITYLPRGYRWEWGGTSFVALGGAASIDKEYRIEGSSWWHQEMISMADAERAVEGGYADVMVTHDSPMEVVPIPNLKMDHRASNQNRETLRKVVEVVTPKLLLHGHYHERFSCNMGATQIEAISRDSSGAKGFLLLDLPTLRVEHPKDW